MTAVKKTAEHYWKTFLWDQHDTHSCLKLFQTVPLNAFHNGQLCIVKYSLNWILQLWNKGLQFFLFPFLPAIYVLKVFVCKINGCPSEEDDSLHEDDIELISEMLQNERLDIYRETWIIKILLKGSWMADSGILFVMINLTQSLWTEWSQIASDKIAFASLRWIPPSMHFESTKSYLSWRALVPRWLWMIANRNHIECVLLFKEFHKTHSCFVFMIVGD